jgi:hypothetical protein
MRRTVGILVGAVTLIGLAGVAAAESSRPADPGRAPRHAGPLAAAGDALGGLVGETRGLVDRLAAGAGEVGRERIGTVERFRTVLRGGENTATIRRPGASYVKVRLARAALGSGGSVTVANRAGTEIHRYEAGDLARSGGRWAMSITGDTAVVTVERGAVTIDRVARGFTAAERAAQRATAARVMRESGRPGPTGREETICGGDDKSDAVCFRGSDPGLYRRSKAIVRLIINGAELCTAWRLGPSNRLVTNHHCFAETREAYRTEVWFNYQCAACGGFAVFQATKVWGHQVLFTDRALDVTVFTVENFADVRKFGHLELETGRPAVGEEVVIPQHAAGEPTMIAARSDTDRSGVCAVADREYDGFAPGTDISYYCDTEGGSSGSPVLSRRTGRVVALHHFGGCPNSGVRSDLLHRRLASVR